MKFLYRLVLAGIITALSLQVQAKSIDALQAQQVAENFLNQTYNLHAKTGSVPILSLVYTATTTNSGKTIPVYYVYNRTNANGYIIVSADDNVTPILGYSDESKFDASNLPPQLTYWLGEYEKQISIIITNNIVSSVANSQWYNYIHKVNVYKRGLPTAVKPLLKTSWDQSQYYWDACPYDNTAKRNAYTGCVATAMAQVMKYWNFPVKGTGSHTYTDATYGSLSANFGNTTYNWSNMPNKLTVANSDVANLMFQCGVAIEMKYGVNGSSAWNTYDSSYQVYPSAHQALKTYFGYDATAIHSIFKSNYSDANWLAKIKTELLQARVVLYEGNDGTPSGSGHCFVADGFDVNSYLHFNWGWSGAYNGYFTITSLIPAGQGSGGGSGNYTSNQGAVIGIKPPTTAVSSVNFTTSTTTTNVGQQITLSDTSSNNPTTWSWSVNPSNATFLNGTSNGSKNPDVSFSVAGKYAVTLTASNSKGSGTLTKTSYIIVNPALTTQVCDSLTNIELDDTIYYYTTAKGYVVGNNEYNHKGCAEKYTMPNSYTHVSGVLVNFAAAMASNSTNTLNVNLYANTNNLPGTILATKAVKLIDIVSDVTNNRLTTVIFDTPIAVSGNFYVGVEYNYASGDTVGINHVKQGNATTNTAFVKYSTGNWYTFNTIWNMNQHLAIQALVSTMPTPNFTITSTPTTINTNVTVDASSSVGAYNYLWTFTSASLNSSQYYTETISYPNAGTFNVQLDVTGGCGIVKSITKTVTVNGNCSGAPAAPATISGTATVCQGQTGINYSVPSVTGATSYVWTLPSGFTGTSTTNSITISAPNAAQNGNLQVQAVNSCGTSTASTLAINSTLTTTPTFNSISSICNGTTLSPLPTTSLNNYTGTWSPALNNTQTTVYTFTPTTGQCASSTTMTITVNQKTTPTFSSMNAICNGTTLSPLPTTSLNNYTGTWSPALDNTQTTVYTFTPTTGQCASSTTMTITVNQKTTPTFSSMNAICNGTTLSPLPTTSLNNFTGTWSPALDNTQTTVYTFTPTTGQCASNTTLTVTVNQKTKPTFSSISPVCIGTTLSPLPTTSLNNISGTWSPTLDNTKTTIYSFTPSQGQCSDTTSLTITVSNTPILPTFIQVTPICAGGNIATLPTVSTNNITGSWSPTLDNTKTTTYTFTPNQGQCASVTSMIVQVDSLPNPGILTIVGTTCQGNSALITSTVKGGVWSSQDNSIVSVDSIGNISSVSQGTTNVSYKLTQKSCVSVVNKTITVGKCAGIEELSKQNISIFPNPTTSILNLQVDNSNYVKLEVISPIGIILLSKNIDQNSTNLDVANFASGIYLIRLYDLQNVPVNVYFNKN